LWEKGIHVLTVASPLLIEYIRRKLSHLKFYIIASVIIGIDSIRRIKQIAKFKVNRITLDIRCNRNFQLLHSIKEIKKELKEIQFEILVNEFCGDCSMRNMHYNLESLHALCYVPKDRFFRDYPFNICTQLFLTNPKDILKNYWILPDWLEYYNKTCKIDWFKITGRTIKDMDWHKFVLEEYMKQEYKGNILNLGPLVIGDLKHEGSKPKVYLDAEIIKEKGYIQYFIKNTPNCQNICGTKCNFCDTLV
jgi:collagenase-like PrtC family protease